MWAYETELYLTPYVVKIWEVSQCNWYNSSFIVEHYTDSGGNQHLNYRQICSYSFFKQQKKNQLIEVTK